MGNFPSQGGGVRLHELRRTGAHRYGYHLQDCDGRGVPILMIHRDAMGYVANAYLDDEGLPNLGVMRQIRFLCRGRVHAEDVW